MATSAHDENLTRLLLSRRLASFAEGSALAALPSLASIVVIIVIYAPYTPQIVTLAWGATFAVLLAIRLRLAHRVLPDECNLGRLRRQFRWVQIVLMGNALTWGVSLPLAAWFGDGRELGAFAAIGAAVFGGVLLMHRALPNVGRFHVAAIGPGSRRAK